LFLGDLVLGLISPGGLGMGDVSSLHHSEGTLDYLGWSQVFYGGLLGFVVGRVITVLLLRLMLRLKRGMKPSEAAHGQTAFAAAVGVALLVP
jgi:leader peptidase (prepilin peptidase)/N-methyltransferase